MPDTQAAIDSLFRLMSLIPPESRDLAADLLDEYTRAVLEDRKRLEAARREG